VARRQADKFAARNGFLAVFPPFTMTLICGAEPVRIASIWVTETSFAGIPAPKATRELSFFAHRYWTSARKGFMVRALIPGSAVAH
jgi:hypothetical protein